MLIMSEPEPNKKEFNKIFLVIPAIALVIIIFALTTIDTDIKEHEALRDIQILDTDIYLDGFDIRADILVYNPNTKYDIDIDRIHIFVYSGNNNIGEITIPQYITIPKNTQVSIPADITVRKTGVLTSILDYVRDKDTNITIQGTVYYDSIFGTHSEPFVQEYQTQQKTAQTSIRQQCNDSVNNYLNVMENALEVSYTEDQVEQLIYDSGYDIEYMMFEINEICNVDDDRGLYNNPNINTQTKNRMIDVMSKMVEFEN